MSIPYGFALGPKSVLLLQVLSGLLDQESKYLDQFGIERGINYLSFCRFDKVFMDCVESNLPQLVFTSHCDSINARDVAKAVKTKNPSAYVFAFTGNLKILGAHNDFPLDGVLFKGGLKDEELSLIVRAFLGGATREEIIQMVLHAKRHTD